MPTNNNGGANEAQGFANFLTGNANGGFSQLSRDPVTDQKFSLYEGFAQDNLKVNPRLTLNLGVRYGYYGQPWDANGLMSNFDPAKYTVGAAPTIASSGLICVTSPCSQAGSNVGLSTTANASADIVGINYIDGIIYNGPNAANNNQASPWGNKVGQAQKANFAPRFGFAYDVFGNGKTSLRGGYGWSYDNAEVSYYETTVFDNPPAVSTYSVSQSTLDTPAGGATTAFSTTPARIQGVPLNFQTPYVQQFSLDIQQELADEVHVGRGLLRRPWNAPSGRDRHRSAAAGRLAGHGEQRGQLPGESGDEQLQLLHRRQWRERTSEYQLHVHARGEPD